AAWEPASRAARLRGLATRIAVLPRFRARLSHERALLQYICERMAGVATELAEALVDRPLLGLRLLSKRAVVGEPTALAFEVENRSEAHAATDVIVQLRGARRADVQGR